MKIIENRDGVATRKIYNVGNPGNNFSVRELAEQMLKLAAEYPEYRANAAKVKLVDTTAGEYYGQGYQDVANRVPKIENTRQELGWEPQVSMRDALKQIFDAYRGQISQACASARLRAHARSDCQPPNTCARTKDRCRYAARHARGRAGTVRARSSGRVPAPRSCSA